MALWPQPASELIGPTAHVDRLDPRFVFFWFTTRSEWESASMRFVQENAFCYKIEIVYDEVDVDKGLRGTS